MNLLGLARQLVILVMQCGYACIEVRGLERTYTGLNFVLEFATV